MARSLWSRVLAGVWGIWLTTSMSGMAGIHMSHGADGHTAGHAHIMEMGSTTPSAAVHGAGRVDHDDIPAVDATRSAASKDDSHHKPAGFACLEQCCCGRPLAIAARAVALGTHPRANAALRRYIEAVTAHARPAHSQPFANGPPSSV
ncbi:MAG TPA: hypothetical protein VNG73_05220 [Gemmatimonadaceae bacterium]|nr:hypothetical protein [Gemmatimonadaceae bacterium]